MSKIVIDGREVEFEEGTTILEAAEMLDIPVPRLCYMKNRSCIGSCRVCSVEVEGVEGLVTSCNTPAKDGMVVSTNTERVAEQRRTALELLLADFRPDLADRSDLFAGLDASQFKNICTWLGVTSSPFEPTREPEPIVDSNPFLQYDPKLCIGCQRCIGACNTAACNHALQTGKIGTRTTILAPFGPDWHETICESCGNCAAACPTGAMKEKRKNGYLSTEVRRTRTTCPHCGVGCQFDLITRGNEIVDVEASEASINGGLLCVKGRSGSFDFVGAKDRLTSPLIKNHETGEFEEASWDEALDLIASKMSAIRDEFGGNALAAFACSRSTNEDIYMLQKMARTAFKTNNVDNCARVCHAPTVAGLNITLGSGAMTNTIADITEDVECIMLVGSNPEEAHPVLGMKIRKAVENGTKLIVVDPRDINLASKADIHLKLKPGTNIAFANGIAHILIEEGFVDEEFVKTRSEGYETYRDLVASYTPERVAEICNIDARDLRAAAHMYGAAKTAPIIYCLGVTEHSTGTKGVMSLSNLAMLCGKFGRKGCGVNPIRGQNNVQGACDMGATPGDFPGYQKLAKPGVFEKFEEAWGVELNREPGIMATECFPAMIEGKIKGLFIFGEDPVRTDADTSHVIKALETVDFLVIDDLFMTESAKYADVVLPGRAYAEKEGTFSNTERRVQRVRKAVEGPEGSWLDTDIFTEIMNRMGYKQEHLTAAQIMDEVASVTPSFAGISHARLDSKEHFDLALQWPCTADDHPGTPIMHVGKFSRGLGLFDSSEYVPSAELTDEKYPLILMTGRVLSQYNACAMTSRTEGLNEMSGSSFIEINTADAQAAGIASGDRVTVTSRRGSLETTARVSDKTNPGETWMPFHFQDGNANWLTIAALDGICKVPEYKVCSVRIEKA